MFGYYLSDDEWVLRRHVQMFTDADIDVLFFDVTNGFTYRKSYLVLFHILSELLSKGFKVPKVAFYTAPAVRGCGTGNLMDLWEQLYEPRLYSELYFYWKGKPLIICHSMRSLPDEVRDFFTWRAPTWQAPEQPNTWAWEGNPQRVSVDENGNPEEIAVNVCRVAHDKNYDGVGYGLPMSEAAYGVPMMGRSWHDGKKDTRENASQYGFLFEEQIEYALKADPPVAFVCQWNEWLVPFLTEKTNTLYNMTHWIRLQDEFNEEYSRDIEPMKDGYKDAYYFQMISFIRRFKGMEKPAADKEYHTICINDDFSQWENIPFTCREYTGDTAPRHHRGYDAAGVYVNNTGRNEFSICKVASDSENIYFYAECSEKISSSDDVNRMMLFLRNPAASAFSWEGYQFVINRKKSENGMAYMEACLADGEFLWREILKIECICIDRKMHIKIPRTALGIEDGAFSIEFKWSDNMQKADVMDFYLNGDCAPRGRLNYLYISETSGVSDSDGERLTSDG